MTTHPSLQPSLRRSNVSTLLQFLRNERDDVLASPGSSFHSELAGYARGLQRAEEMILTMWASAVLATEAHARDIEAALEEDDC